MYPTFLLHRRRAVAVSRSADTAGADPELGVLLSLYEQLVYRDNVLVQTVFQVVGVGATVVTLLLVNVPGYDPKGSGFAASKWAYLSIPLLPSILIGLVVFMTLQINMTAQYSHVIETALAKTLGTHVDGSTLGIEGVRVQNPSFLRLTSRIFGAGKRESTRIYTAAAIVTVVFLAVLVVGGPAYVMRDLPGSVQLAAVAIFVPFDLLLAAALVRGSMPRRRLLRDAIFDVVVPEKSPSLEAEPLPTDESDTGDGHDRSIVSYLIAPRTVDHVAKVLLGLIGITIGCVTLAQDRNLSAGRIVGEVLAFVLIFEYLFYQARYSWNDLRDADFDLAHPMAHARGRIPPSVTPARARLVLLSVIFKTGLGVLLALTIAEAQAIPLLVGLGSLWVVAILYELVRDHFRHRRVEPWTPEARVWSRLILVLVGPGYAIRMVVGAYIGSQGHVSFAVIVILAATGWAFEIATVAMDWVLEGSMFLHGNIGVPAETEYLEGIYPKAHIGYLLIQAGLLSPKSQLAPPKTPTEHANTKLKLLSDEYHADTFTAWTLAGAVAITFGTLVAVSLANEVEFPSTAVAAAAIAGGTLASLQCFKPKLLAPLWAPLVAVLAVVILGVLEHMSGLLTTLGALLIAGLCIFYEGTRTSDYDFVIGFLRHVAEKIATIVKRLTGRTLLWFTGTLVFQPSAPPPSPSQDTPPIAEWE
jgi:hypothetical protein